MKPLLCWCDEPTTWALLPSYYHVGNKIAHLDSEGMTHGSPVHEHRAASVLGCLPKDLLAEWLQALGVMGHRGRYFWLTQSLSGSSQGKESWGGLVIYLIPVLPVQQVDAEDRALPSLLPIEPSQLGGEASMFAEMLGPHTLDV